MKSISLLQLVAFICAFGGFLGLRCPARADAALCAGCAQVQKLADDLKLLNSPDVETDESVQKLIIDVSRAVSTMPAGKNKKLKAEQIEVLVSLLRISVNIDKNRRIIDDNVRMIQANKAEFDAEVAKLAQNEAQAISRAVAIVIRQTDGPHDAMPIKHPKAGQK